MAFGFLCQVFHYWSSVISCWSLVFGHPSLFFGLWSLVVGHWFSVFGRRFWSSVVGLRSSVVGLRSSVFGTTIVQFIKSSVFGNLRLHGRRSIPNTSTHAHSHLRMHNCVSMQGHFTHAILMNRCMHGCVHVKMTHSCMKKRTGSRV